MAFDKNDTQQKIISIIAEELKIDKNKVIEEKTLQDLGADSLDMVQMIMRFEEVFGMEINDEDAEKLGSLAQLVDYVQAHRTK